MSEQAPSHTGHAQAASSDPLFVERQKRFFVLELVTKVQADGLYVRLHPFRREPHHIPFSAIVACEVTHYSSSDHFGWHWGMRVTPDGTVYRLSGDAGVLLRLEDDRRVFIGSQRADELERAIAAARGRE